MIGIAILILSVWPFTVLATVSFATFAMFRPSRRFALPSMSFFTGYALGNVFAHEQWAEPLLRFTWAKPLAEAPLHSLTYSIGSVILVYWLLSFGSVVLFRVMAAAALLTVCFPTAFVAIFWATMALFRTSAFLFPFLCAMLGSLLLNVVIYVQCRRNEDDFVRHEVRAGKVTAA